MESRNPEMMMRPEPAAAPESKEVVTLTDAQEAQAAHWLAQIEAEQAAVEKPEQTETEKAREELGAIFDEWLVPEKLAPLHALETQAEAMADPLRKEAKAALAKITPRLKLLGDPVDLTEKYRELSRAVGMINSGKVDHTR
jgi:hypothetical protein